MVELVSENQMCSTIVNLPVLVRAFPYYGEHTLCVRNWRDPVVLLVQRLHNVHTPVTKPLDIPHRRVNGLLSSKAFDDMEGRNSFRQPCAVVVQQAMERMLFVL